jgi:tryptophanyl-tRNA synthetase
VRILKESAKVFDLQNPESKMSKSGESPQGIVWLLDEPAVVAKKIKSAVTDTDREIRFDTATKPGVSNLLGILSLLSGTSIAAWETDFAGKGYGDLKSAVADAVVAEFEPIRARTLELLADPAELDRMLAANAERANEIAEATLSRVYDAVGFLRRT